MVDRAVRCTLVMIPTVKLRKVTFLIVICSLAFRYVAVMPDDRTFYSRLLSPRCVDSWRIYVWLRWYTFTFFWLPVGFTHSPPPDSRLPVTRCGIDLDCQLPDSTRQRSDIFPLDRFTDYRWQNPTLRIGYVVWL